MKTKTFASALLLIGTTLFAFATYAQQTARPLGTTTAPYGFYEYLPFGYDASLPQKWPVVIFLHGHGELGNGTTQLSDVTTHCIPNYIKTGTNYPFIVISPQTPVWWEAATLDQMVEHIKRNYKVDENRIYITGWSMGGGGTWRYVRAHPEKLAVVMPLAGARAGNDIYEGAKLVHVPSWIFHSWGDSTVSADQSVRWANSIASALTGLPSNVMANYPGTFTGPPGPGNTSDRTRTASFNAATNTWTWNNELVRVAGSSLALTLFSDKSHFICPRTYNDSTQAPLNWLLAQTRYSATGDHNKAPSVTITAPARNAVFNEHSDLSIKATVADTDGVVSKLEFYAGALKLGEDNTAPYERVWANIPAGTHWLTVKATDNDGSTSAAVVKISVQPSTATLITPTLAGGATGSPYFPMQFAFDAQPTLDANGQPVGGTGGSDAPYYANRYGYIDFGPEWYKVRITSTWTRYRVSSGGNQTPYAALWWDDDIDTVNDSGLNETRINFNTAQGLSTGSTEPWIRDRELSANPVVPKARYLLLHSPAVMTNRAKEYAMVGRIDAGAIPPTP